MAVWKLRCRALFEPRDVLLAEYSDAYGVTKSSVRCALRGKPSWGWIPFPQDEPTAALLSQKLGVSGDEASELLAAARLEARREAA